MSNEALPSQPQPGDSPVFREPWEAQVFAITVLLHQRGLFGWTEWTRTLGARIASATALGIADSGETYYHHWLAALETLVAAKGLGSIEELIRYQRAWDRAAHDTPHGLSIELQPQHVEATDIV
jgi:nitrile hydratase accessory protein